MSIRTRTTLVATAVVAVALAAALGLVTWLVRANLTASAEEQAQRALDTATARLTAGQDPALVSDGTTTVTIAAPGALPASPAPVTRDSVAFARLVPTDTGAHTVVSQTSLAATDSALSTLALAWTALSLLILLAVALTTRMAVRGALRPIERIRSEFADITASDLHRRVPSPRAHDEVAQLATTMNATLDRLENAVGRHRQFVADASHELRGPIAALRTELELAVDHPSRTDWPASARDALTDALRLEHLTGDLLFLARMDADEPTRYGDVDLGTTLADLARRRPAVRTHLPGGPVTVHGSAPHLRRLLANVLDNAARHHRAQVEVHLSTSDSATIVHVDDDGNGIAPEDRERVFDRFTRLDEARTRDRGGAGLGLAIARDIAHRHGGTLHAAEAPLGGARLTLRLPSGGSRRAQQNPGSPGGLRR